jgi:RNA polymerase sigma-70 factor (ECF subfamily)
MHTSMRPSLEQELLQHGVALRSLARALVGDTDADDLVQETALAALRASPQPGPNGAWFAGILRRLASRHWRSQRRRLQRERAVARAVEEPRDRGLETHEILRALTEAVLGLPEPYRETIIQRYLRELPPRAIAAAAAEPVETIKSRLQRGLAMLRAQLAGRQQDWRPALTTVFGLEPQSVVAATTGVVLMGTMLKLVCVAGVTLALWIWFGVGPGEPTASPIAAGVKGPAAASAQGTDAVEQSPVDANARIAATHAVSPEAVIRGHCVDDRHADLRDCSVTLHAGASVLGESASQADGTFQLTCAPKKEGIELRVVCAGRAAFTMRWPDVAAGQVIEVGDIKLTAARAVSLRTIDGSGRAVPRAVLDFAACGAIRTDDLGTATVTLPVGRLWLSAVPPAYRSEVDIVEGTGVQELAIPLAPMTDSIDGCVIDEQARPIPLAQIRLSLDEHDVGRVITGGDGFFAIARTAAAGAAGVDLDVDVAGFERQHLRAVAWNTHALSITLRAGVAVEIRVHRLDESPVEQFSAYLWSRPDDGLRHAISGTFPGGSVRFVGVRRGPARLTVMPLGDDVAEKHFIATTVVEGSNQIEVALPSRVTRPLRVQSTDGTPVPGVTFFLAQSVNGQKLDSRSGLVKFTGDPSVWEDGTLPGPTTFGLFVQEGVTGADGTAELRGPASEQLTLYCGVGDMQPQQVTLPGLDPVVVALPLSGQVHGRLGPPSLVTGLRGLYAQTRGRSSPRLVELQPGRDVGGSDGARNVEVEVEVDGTFTAIGLAPGTWQATLQILNLEAGVFMRNCGSAMFRVEPQQTAEVDLQLPDLAPAELHADVVLDGEPAVAAAVLCLEAKRDSRRMTSLRGSTDAAGAFAGWLMPATYIVNVRPLPATGETTGSIAFADPILVTPGAEIRRTLALASGRARLHFVDINGLPVVGHGLEVETSGHLIQTVGPTDVEGRCALRFEPGDYQLFARRSRSSSDRKDRIDLGVLQLGAGQVVAREIKLPADWER